MPSLVPPRDPLSYPSQQPTRRILSSCPFRDEETESSKQFRVTWLGCGCQVLPPHPPSFRVQGTERRADTGRLPKSLWDRVSQGSHGFGCGHFCQPASQAYCPGPPGTCCLPRWSVCAGPWWVAQVEARLGDRQERCAGVAQVAFPFLVTCNVPDCEPSELPFSARHGLLLPTL